MCGIFALYNPDGIPQRPDPYLAALRRIAHRGPDDEGYFLGAQTFIGHRRLSILDLSEAGHQPMLSDDERIVLAFNGQIYNHLEVKRELMEKGYIFRSTCDTEVILRAYEEWNERCFDRLRGMWAIVIWDAREEKLVASRDHVGQKPLYLFRSPQDGTWVLASEIKAILNHSGEAARMDRLSVFRFVTRGWLDFTSRTFFADIESLPPATVTVFRNGKRHDRRYWSLRVRTDPGFTPEALFDVFTDTIHTHLQGDVPVSIALSGGVDSASIASVATNVLGTRDKVCAFSVIPPSTTDETPWIEATVRHTGIAHEYVDVGNIDYRALMDEIVAVQDEPIPKVNHAYQYLLRKHVGERGFKVLLAGEGSDEIFAGYAAYAPMYLAALRQEGRDEDIHAFMEGAGDLTGQTPSEMLAAADSFLRNGAGRRVVQQRRFGYELMNDDSAFPECQAFPEFRYLELEERADYPYLLNEMRDRFEVDMPFVLRIEDRNGMCRGLEVRSPFLDHVMVEHGFQFSQSSYMKGGINKYPFRRALGSTIAPEVAENLKKMRRPGNDAHIMYDHLHDALAAMLVNEEFRSMGIWRDDLLEKFEHDRKTRNIHNAFVWFRVYMVGRWYHQYVA